MSGGGEILRAVLEKNCVYSNPALYCIPLNARDGTGAATSIDTAFLQLDKQYAFLATSIYCTTSSGAAGGYERINNPEFIRLFDPADQSNFVLVPGQMQGSLFGDASLNNPFILPTYMLWPQAALIGVEWNGENYATTGIRFLTLQGIEYGMRG